MTSEPGASAATRWVLRGCLLASGAAGLTYEVLWLRSLGLVMGNTAYALSAVLTAFLGGLALGAYAAGRWTAARRDSAKTYGMLELAIAATGLATPLLISACDPLFGLAYRSLSDHFLAYNLVQFAICATVLAVPTFLMGATLPVVASLLSRDSGDIVGETGLLYALNSLGGVLGAGIAGFVLLPTLGAFATGTVAASLNVAAAVAAFLVAGTRPAPARAEVPSAPRSPARTARPKEAPLQASPGAWESPGRSSLTLLYGLSGVAALMLEVSWARVVGLSIGSTTYGFTITLVTYIAGIALGSFAAPRVPLLTRDPVRSIFFAHALLAAWILASLPYLGSLPLRVVELLGPGEPDFHALLAGEALLVQLTIAVPTIAMGAMFPLVAQLLHRAGTATGQSTGVTYAANTLGNIAGSWIAGFLLIPAIGMQGTVRFSAVVYAVTGLGFLFPSLRVASRRRVAGGVALVAGLSVAAWAMPAWNRELLSSAPYLAGDEITRLEPAQREEALRARGGALLDYREGATGVVTVRERQGSLGLYQDGMQESGTGSHSIRLLGHLALLFHGSAKDVLIVGLGGGQTLRGVLMHPVKSVESVEISQDVVDVTRRYFAGDILGDPRSRVLVGDGRNHLRHSGRRYDVIVSQPSYPWVAGASNLFTREYFAEMRAHLAPGGVAAAWFFTRSKKASRAITKAWSEVFPEALLLNAMGGPRVLIGFEKPGSFRPEMLSPAFADPRVAGDLGTFSLDAPADVLRLVVARGPGLQQVAGDTPPSTDDNGLVAFHSLRSDEE